MDAIKMIWNSNRRKYWYTWTELF